MSKLSNPWETKWEIVRDIGSGGQGLTYLVRNKDDSSLGVLKRLKNNKSATQRARMHREAANLFLLNAIPEAKVPKLLDENTSLHNIDFTQLYIVIEYIEGKTLSEFVKAEGVFSLDDASDIISKIAVTLRAAFTEDIIHRDLKPDNIILRKTDAQVEVFVIDFGLSFNVGNDDLTEADEPFRNRFLILPEYNSPGDRRDPRSDITALAAIFCYLMTAELPGTLLDSNNRMPHRRTSSIRNSLKDDSRLLYLEVFFDKAFKYDIRDRYQSLDEFNKNLCEVVSYSNDVRNLSSLAKVAHASMYANDRETQLAEMSLVIQPVMAKMGSMVSKINEQTKPNFQVVAHALKSVKGSNGERLKHATSKYKDFENIAQIVQVVEVKNMLNTILTCFHFVIAAKNQECFLLCQEANSPHLHSYDKGWREVKGFTLPCEQLASLIDLEIRGCIADFLKTKINAV